VLSSITVLRFSSTLTPGRSLGVIAAKFLEQTVRSRSNYRLDQTAKVHATSSLQLTISVQSAIERCNFDRASNSNRY